MSEIENDVISIIKKHSPDKDLIVTKDSKLRELDLESISLLGISVDLENHFKITLDDEYGFPFETISDLSHYINLQRKI